VKVLDLFSGIGGFSLGLEAAGMQTAAFCEFDDRARQVLRKNWPTTPIFEDVRTLNKELLDEQGVNDIRLICGGYPCQPFSFAGERRGAEDDRHLWPEMFRLVQELRPAWVIGENVAGHITMGLDQVLADLEAANYSTRSFVIPACAVDAPHRRDRVWTVAHTNGESQSDGPVNEQRVVANSQRRSRRHTKGVVGGKDEKTERSQNPDTTARSSQDVAHSTGERTQRGRSNRQQESFAHARQGLPLRCSATTRRSQWLVEPSVGRVADGVPNRTHRLKQLGNAVVPQVVQVIGEMIMQVEREQAA
jgi:DNA (cytosine-5)-methyltransferase 1